MGKILLILLVVGVVFFIISLLSGSSSEDAAASGCMSSLGCGYAIGQLVLYAFILMAIIAFVCWLFD